MDVRIIGNTQDPWAQAVRASIPTKANTKTVLLINNSAQIFGTPLYRMLGFRVLWLGSLDTAVPKQLVPLVSRFAHAIIAPNQATEAQYLKAGVSDKKLALVYPPCEIRTSDTKDSQTFTIACDGETSIDHGLGMIMRAVRDAKDILGDIVLIIGGAIADRGRAEWLAQELDMRDSVKLVPARGYGWIASCDVFLFMRNNNTPVPLSLAHALAAGKPVITNDALPHREFVVHHKNGILLKDANSDMLSQALINLGRKPEWLAELGRESAQFAHERFSPDIVKKKIEALIP